MNTAIVTVLLWVASFGSTLAAAGEIRQEPIQLDHHRQLFIDDYIVAETQGVRRVVNQPEKHPANPLIQLDRPWEGEFMVGGWGSAVYDEADRLFKMWYMMYPVPDPSMMCYAFSKDGIHWEKPALGLVERNGSKANNIVPGLRNLTTILSPDDPDPNKRFKAFFGRRGTFSPDGIHWDTLGSKDIPGPIVSDNVITYCYDHLTDQFVAAVKINTGSGRRQRRSVWISFSKDFLEWSEPKLVLEPDAEDDALNRRRIAKMSDQVVHISDPKWQIAQFYGMIPFPYEGMYIGMLQVLDVSAAAGGTDDTKLSVGGGGEDGLVHAQLTSSRDLLHWQRVGGRQMFLPQGPASAWDAGTAYTYCPPIVVGDELWIYYTSEGISHGNQSWYGISWQRLSQRAKQGGRHATAWYREDPDKTPIVYRIGTKGPTSGVGLARLRLDGWVSIDADQQGGTLTTKSLVFDPGKTRLVINAKALEGGSVVVEIVDRAGNALPGFDKADCYPLQHDALRHTVVWGGESDVSKLAGKPIRLRFHLKTAKLYSFVFKDS